MARCGSSCPYHWHDSDCEYCSARNDEVIDLKYYDYDTCPYYQEYLKNRRSSPSNQPPRSSGSGCLGCLGSIIVVVVIVYSFFHPLPLFADLLRDTNSGRTVSSSNTAQTKPPAEKETDVPGEALSDQDSVSPVSGEELSDQGFIPSSSGGELPDQGFIFPGSNLELIDQREINALSDKELTYAINEIYARHGYIFQSDELREYYEQFSWYVGEIPSAEFSIDCFNQTEMQNWTLLVGERDKRKASG